MKTDIQKCKDLFESIIVLCVEGPEVVRPVQLFRSITQEAVKGIKICDSGHPKSCIKPTGETDPVMYITSLNVPDGTGTNQ